jgi:hypothetical protein
MRQWVLAEYGYALWITVYAIGYGDRSMTRIAFNPDRLIPVRLYAERSMNA